MEHVLSLDSVQWLIYTPFATAQLDIILHQIIKHVKILMSAAVIQLTDANKYAIIEMDLMPVAVIKDFD